MSSRSSLSKRLARKHPASSMLPSLLSRSPAASRKSPPLTTSSVARMPCPAPITFSTVISTRTAAIICPSRTVSSIPGLSTLMAQLGFTITVSTTSGRWTTPLTVLTINLWSRPSTIPAPQVSTCPPLTPSLVSRRMVRIKDQ